MSESAGPAVQGTSHTSGGEKARWQVWHKTYAEGQHRKVLRVESKNRKGVKLSTRHRPSAKTLTLIFLRSSRLGGAGAGRSQTGGVYFIVSRAPGKEMNCFTLL